MTDEIKRQEIVDIARTWTGTRYHHQASMKGVGCDCLGLLRGVYREVYGLEVDPEDTPPYQPHWYEHTDRDELLYAAGRHLQPATDLLPGNVLVFRMKPRASAKHCAIVTGPDTMIHAYSGREVFEVNMGEHWIRKVCGIFQFPGVVD